MPDDPVRGALREAARSLCDVEGPVACEPPCGGCVHMAAAAVAAFLRTLPHTGTMGVGAYEGCVASSDPSRNSGVWHATELAREVERAAGGGHDTL